MVRWTFINAVGGVIISALTLVAASYLLFSLWSQGRGKLRVRLLLGMVISDVLLGWVLRSTASKGSSSRADSWRLCRNRYICRTTSG